MPVPLAQVLGQEAGQLLADADRPASIACPLHAGLREPLLALQQAAAAEGFALRVVSGWRSFEHQRRIWNAKADGQRPVLDDTGRPLDLAALPAAEQVRRILRWSALPGASRHHWGTDIDVIDAAALPDGHRVQLTVAEARGLCGAFHAWLDARIADGSAFGFYRPYASDTGGVAPEPWHLSYRPLAAAYADRLTLPVLRAAIEACDLALKAAVLADLEALFARFVVRA